MLKLKLKEKKRFPELSTASLPDIVFILLFFFMVATTLRDQNLKVRVTEPYCTELKRLEKKSLVSHIYIGKPFDTETRGNASLIQINDAFATTSQIKDFIFNEIQPKSPNVRGKMFVSLCADKNTEMGIITDVKQELRKANALKINYSSKQGTQKQIFDNLR